MSTRPIATRLSKDDLAFFENGFGVELKSVRLMIGRDATRVPFAVGDRVVMPESWYRPGTSGGRLVLAHELAHVVQKRRGRRSLRRDPAEALETEARAAARTVASGGRFHCRMADASGCPRYWGEAGHYYTAYLVMLAAGATPSIAFEMARLAQMPDQVEDLDATHMGMLMPQTIPPPRSARQMDGFAFSVRMEREAALRRQALRQRIREIQEGIHALTGRSAEAETRLRREVLLRATLPSLEFGLAIHAYGDSFAHRRMNGSGTMYIGPLGHAVHLVEDDPQADTSGCNAFLNPRYSGANAIAYLACSFSRRFLHDPHEPDHLHRRRELYAEYGLGLYDILCEKMPSVTRPMSRDDLAKGLDKVSKLGSEADQIAKLREIASLEVRLPMDSAYQPEREAANGPLSWEQYLMNHQQGGPAVAPYVLQDSQDTARQWTTLRP